MTTCFWRFREQLEAVGDETDITIEVTTPGGDADCARRICVDIRIAREHCDKSFWFAGRSTVYSAGASIMAAFPRERRFLSCNCVLKIHERKMKKEMKFDSAIARVRTGSAPADRANRDRFGA